jgi:hypothetical protein
MYIKDTIHKHSTNNSKHSQYKYTYNQTTTQLSKQPHNFQNNHTLNNTHIHTPTHYKQVKTNIVQDTHQKKQSQYIQVHLV